MADAIASCCSLTPEERRVRRSEVRATLVPKVLSSTSLADGLRVDFEPSDALRNQVSEFVALEQECCGFLRFTLSKPAEGLFLLVQGPPEAADVIEMFRQVLQRDD